MHARMKPKAHRFQYRVFNLLVDIDRLGEPRGEPPVPDRTRPRPRQLSRERPWRWTEPAARPCRALAGAGRRRSRRRAVLLLCYPRIFGFVFNPISLYFCYDSHERCWDDLRGSQHLRRDAFLCRPGAQGELNEAGLRQARDKIFYVFSFLDMPLRYHFRVLPPGETVKVRILETDRDGPILRRPLPGNAAP